MQHDYFERAKAIDYEEIYKEIRFTTPFLVYKIKKLWVVLDKISQSSFVIISVMIMVLSNYWQISLSMAIHLTCFISLCLVIASKLYQNRKKDKKKLKTKQKESNFDQTRSQNLKLINFHVRTTEDCGDHWTAYKKEVNYLQVDVR